MKYQKITLSLAGLTSIFSVGINYANDAKTLEDTSKQTTTVLDNTQSDSATDKTAAIHAITPTNDKAGKADKVEDQSKPKKGENAKKSDGSDQTIYNQYYNFLQFNLALFVFQGVK